MRPPIPPPRLTRRLRSHNTLSPFPKQLRSMHSGLRSFPAWFVRGGTSNGLVIRSADLPPRPSWPDILPPAMGSPDALHGRQLDGVGSGVSSTSKVVVLSPPGSSRRRSSAADNVHVEYTFVQVGIRDGALDTAGNCGNMSSVVGPAAWDMGYVRAADKPSLVRCSSSSSTQWATLRILNTNTDKVIETTFRVAGSGDGDGDTALAYCPEGAYRMDGVPGTHSPITMSFLDPAGTKTGRALPTGNPVDTLALPDGSAVRASLVDVSNPGVFVDGASVLAGFAAAAAAAAEAQPPPPPPAAIEADTALKERLEMIRRAGAQMMGLDPDTESVPKIVLLFPGGGSEDVDIRCRAMSMGQAHKAVPLTLALCLGAAARMEGTLAWRMLRDAGRPADGDVVRIAHPSGSVDVGTTIERGEIKAAKLLRTARVLMKGEVFY